MIELLTLMFVASFLGTLSACIIFGGIAYKKIKEKLEGTMLGGMG